MPVLGPRVRKIKVYSVDFPCIENILNTLGIHSYEYKVGQKKLFLLLKRSYEHAGVFFYSNVIYVGIFCRKRCDKSALSGAYLNALFNFTQLALLPSIPALAMDMAGAILNVVLVQLGQMGDHALVIETKFISEDDGINGHFFLVPDPGSLETILSAVGVE